MRRFLVCIAAAVLFVPTTLTASEGAAALAASAQGSADAALVSRVTDAIRLSPHFSIFDDVNVDARDGVVTLTGCVTMPYKRDGIAATAARVPGARSVTNTIHVLPASPTDAKLRTKIADAIYGHPSFRRLSAMTNPPIHIIVADGRVTLTGVVSTEVDRTLAFTLAHVAGAVDVANKLRVDRDKLSR